MSTTGGIEFVETEPLRENLDELPAPVRPNRRLPVATALLALCAMACVGFAVGVAIEKRQLPAAASTQASAAAGGAGGAGGAAGRTGGPTTTAADGTPAAGRAGAAGAGAAAGQGAVVGQVRSIDGTAVVLVDAAGNTVRVTTTDATQVTKTGALGDIKPGDYLTVMGTTAADGSTQAVRIVDTGTTPQAAGGPAGRAGGAGAGAAATTATTTATTAAGAGPTSSTPQASGPAGSRPPGSRPGGGPTTTVP